VSATKLKFDVVKLAPHIGAEIRGLDLREGLDDATISGLVDAWHDNIILLFRDQKLSQKDLLRVTAFFGEAGGLHRPMHMFPKGYDSLEPGIMLISNIREDGEPIGALPDGEMMFHHDTIHAEVPSKGTLLYGIEIPSKGGNTIFANGYVAYETLDPHVRDRLEGRTAQHVYNYGSVQKGDGKGTPAVGAAAHPVFRTHDETGRKAVYVNRLMTETVVGLERDESDRLLAAVFDNAEKMAFTYEHVWRVGDLILWDNRCSSHARTDFSAGERRLLLRTTVQGTFRLV
jgi:taurine dioxygenase